MEMLGPVTLHRTICGPFSISSSGSRPLQAFLPPKPLNTLVVHSPALKPPQSVGHASTPADVLNRDLPEAMAEHGLLKVDNLASMALGTAVLYHNPAGRAFTRSATHRQER